MTVFAFVTGLTWLLAVAFAIGAVRGRGILRKCRRLFAAALCAGLGVLLATLLALHHGFQTFADETLVARVVAIRLGGNEFELAYQPAQGQDKTARTLRLQGDQWSVSGGVVKWHPWLTLLGLRSYHKPMRLSGQFSNLARQRANPPTIYALAPEPDRVWECLYRASRYLPFIDAVYGSSAYVYVEPAVTQEIYVTPSGYMIKRYR